MRNLHSALENLKYDKRMTDWNIQNGIITQSDLDGHMNSLNDESSAAESLELNESAEQSAPEPDESANGMNPNPDLNGHGTPTY